MAAELQAGDPQVIGPYRLVGRLGQGGMGQVFLGVSPGGRPVAVKAIRPDLAADPQFRARFGREVAAARRVSGVFTAMVVDADPDGPVAWLATAYVPGPSLADAVGGHGPLPEASLLALAAGLAESLNAIHAAGVVHRDLKPSNVLLAEDGPRVIDFGISRAAESTALTQTGLVVGSPGFMSPEQAIGGEVGPPSDIFSLGAVLAFAAAGEGPFGGGTTAALLYRVVHGTPDLDSVPAAVRPLVERCLEKDPARRPTAAALLAEVGALQLPGSWLPDSIIRTIARDPGPGTVPAAPSSWTGSDPATQTAAAGQATPLPAWGAQPPAAAGGPPATTPDIPPPPDTRRQPAPGAGSRPRRRLLLRPLVLAPLIVLAASGATAYALTSYSGHPSAPVQQRPVVQISSLTSPASSASSAPAAPASARASSQPTGAYSSASAYTAPSASGSSSPSASVSPSASGTPSPSASSSSAPSASPSPSPSPSALSSPSASVSPSASAAPSASVSTAPAGAPSSAAPS